MECASGMRVPITVEAKAEEQSSNSKDLGQPRAGKQKEVMDGFQKTLAVQKNQDLTFGEEATCTGGDYYFQTAFHSSGKCYFSPCVLF